LFSVTQSSHCHPSRNLDQIVVLPPSRIPNVAEAIGFVFFSSDQALASDSNVMSEAKLIFYMVGTGGGKLPESYDTQLMDDEDQELPTKRQKVADGSAASSSSSSADSSLAAAMAEEITCVICQVPAFHSRIKLG